MNQQIRISGVDFPIAITVQDITIEREKATREDCAEALLTQNRIDVLIERTPAFRENSLANGQ